MLLRINPIKIPEQRPVPMLHRLTTYKQWHQLPIDARWSSLVFRSSFFHLLVSSFYYSLPFLSFSFSSSSFSFLFSFSFPCLCLCLCLCHCISLSLLSLFIVFLCLLVQSWKFCIATFSHDKYWGRQMCNLWWDAVYLDFAEITMKKVESKNLDSGSNSHHLNSRSVVYANDIDRIYCIWWMVYDLKPAD